MDKNKIKEKINQFSFENYLEVLPPPSREAASNAVEIGIDLFAFAANLALEPGQGLATKGINLWSTDMFPKIINEFYLLLCTNDPVYDAWREKLGSEGSKTAKAVVLVCSTSIAATIGVVPALILPFVAVILAAIAKMTLQAWCKSQSEIRKLIEAQQNKIIEGGVK